MRSQSLIARLSRRDASHPETGADDDAYESAQERARRLTRIYFGIGLACSGILGSLAFLIMLLLATGPAHDLFFAAAPQKPTLGLYDALPRPARSEAPSLVTLDLAVPHTERGGVRVMLDRALTQARDAQSADDFAIVLRHLPQSVSLSRGRREGQSWRLSKADLNHLYLVIGPAAPDAFEIGIDVEVSRAPVRGLGRLRVRVVEDRSVPSQPVAAAAPSRDVAQRVSAPVAPGPARGTQPMASVDAAAKRPVAQARPAPVAAGAVAKPSLPQVAEEPAATRSVDISGVSAVSAAPQPVLVADAAAVDVVRPKGISGLGGPGAQTTGSDPDTLFGRKLWWRLPQLPSWPLFK